MPISKIATFAREVNVDPVYMMRLVLQEYSPDVYSSLDQYVALALTLSESNALRAIREGADGVAIELDKSELAWIKEIANRASLRTKQEQKKAEDIDKQRWNSPLNKD